VEGRSGRSEITDSGEEEEGEGGEIGQVRNVGLALGRGRGTWRRRDWAVFVRNVDRVSQFADALCPLPHRWATLTRLASPQVNKKVGQTLASGIESAETTTSQAKETVRE
jgi:hypothetical protein